MELYRVELEYADVRGMEAWEKSLAGKAPQPMPPRKTLTVFVAVRPDWSGDPVGRAGSLAVEKTICTKDSFEKYQPTVTMVQHVGVVLVEPGGN